MLIDDLLHNKTNIFIATDNLEHTYRTVSMLYLAMHGARKRLPTYLLDVAGTSESLLKPTRSLAIADVDKLDLHNPDKTFVILATAMPTTLLQQIRTSFGLDANYPPSQVDQVLQATNFNHVNYGDQLYNQRHRAFGTGAIVHLVGCFENVYDLGNYFKSIQQLEDYDFSGFLIRGVANTNQFKLLSMRSSIANLPVVSLQPTFVTDIPPAPKKLLVCYSATMIRFMAIENIKYFVKMQNPALFATLEFSNLADLELTAVRERIEKSFAFICLDMGQEHSILMPEAMYAKNIILGFGGNFDNESDLTDSVVDFSPECDYRDVANKLVRYAQIYKQALEKDANYTHEMAQAAHTHASINYTSDKLVKTLHTLLTKLGVSLYGIPISYWH